MMSPSAWRELYFSFCQAIRLEADHNLIRDLDYSNLGFSFCVRRYISCLPPKFKASWGGEGALKA